MPNIKNEAKDIFTTGDVANICRISQQTIIRCFDSGQLQGFRIPGSRWRKISRQSLIKFMKENKIPMDNFEPGKRVLIIDDDQEIINLLVDTLTKEGFEIKTASDGYEAGILTQQSRPHLILLDYMLPFVNSYMVCQTVTNNPELGNTKIIIMSGVVEEESIRRLLQYSGVADFIKKPFTSDEIMSKVSAIMQ